MKISRLFCGRFLSAAIPPAPELAALLTARGLEVEAIVPVARAQGIVVGEITACEPHPAADSLQLCTVDIGSTEPLVLVCGAPNARAGLRVAVAPAQTASLGESPMQARTIRGVASAGMICSARELGIGADGAGIMELTAADGGIGDLLDAHLLLNDEVLEVNITPNRGDCLSHLGIAREVAAAIGCETRMEQLAAANEETIPPMPVHIDKPALTACPYYGCLIVRDCDCARPAPWWLRTLIERCGGRSVSTVVDITNYVMLAWGQPLHAFDLDTLHDGIHVRYAVEGESLTVLDGNAVSCGADTLLIADSKRAQALAGVMGGADSGVTAGSRHILLEAAHFTPAAVAGRARHFRLNSEAAFRFERGVDFQLPPAALRQAAAWMQKLCGGRIGALSHGGQLPPPPAALTVPIAKIHKILGITIDTQTIVALLNSVQLSAALQDGGECIEVAVPSWRADIKITQDIVEEIVRLYGYDAVPETMPQGGRDLQQQLAQPDTTHLARRFFAGHGFNEIISYAFVAPAWEKALSAIPPQPLANPMSEDMSVMRTTLWGGLLDRALFNSRRHQNRLCLFEIGRCFLPTEEGDLPHQPLMVAGLMQGARLPTQWGAAPRLVDFYDIKGMVEMFLSAHAPRFAATDGSAQPALHPGKAAAVYINDRRVGAVGELHPANAFYAEFKSAPFLFSLDLDAIAQINAAVQQDIAPLSPFSPLFRDLALVVDSALAVGDLLAAAREAAPCPPVSEITLFDFYQGDGERIAADKKGCGLRFLLQGQDANLTGEEIEAIMQNIVSALKNQFALELRE